MNKNLNDELLLSTPYIKCLFCHEEQADGNIQFCIDIAREFSRRGVDTPEVQAILDFSYNRSINYFEIKQKVRSLIHCLKINPITGRSAKILYVLCMFEQMEGNFLSIPDCLQLVGDFMRDEEDFFYKDEIMTFYWNKWSDDPDDVEKAIIGFKFFAERINKEYSIGLSAEDDCGMRNLIILQSKRDKPSPPTDNNPLDDEGK